MYTFPKTYSPTISWNDNGRRYRKKLALNLRLFDLMHIWSIRDWKTTGFCRIIKKTGCNVERKAWQRHCSDCICRRRSNTIVATSRHWWSCQYRRNIRFSNMCQFQSIAEKLTQICRTRCFQSLLCRLLRMSSLKKKVLK